MRRKPETGLDFLIDKLTNSIENVITGDSFQTELSVVTVAKADSAAFKSNSQAWTTQTVSLPSGAAWQATLYIAFDFISAYGNNCHLDLVHITATSP